VRRNVQGATVRRALFERRLHDSNPPVVIVVAVVVISAVERSCSRGRQAAVAAVSCRLVETAPASSDSQLTWTIRYVIQRQTQHTTQCGHSETITMTRVEVIWHYSRHRCEQGIPIAKSPLPEGERGQTSVPAKWHLIPSNDFSKVNECIRRHTYGRPDRPRYGNMCRNWRNRFQRCCLIITHLRNSSNKHDVPAAVKHPLNRL